MAGRPDLLGGRAVRAARRPADPRLQARFWATEDAARRIAALGGQDLDALRDRRDEAWVQGRPARRADVRRARQDRAPRRDRERDGEAARQRSEARARGGALTAHHDHLGVKPGAAPGDDAIYNGAVDNATGVAGLLAIAKAAAALPPRAARAPSCSQPSPPRRRGLLGSEWLARHPPVPAGEARRLHEHGRARHLRPHA